MGRRGTWARFFLAGLGVLLVSISVFAEQMGGNRTTPTASYWSGAGWPYGGIAFNVCTQAADDATPSLGDALRGGCNILLTATDHSVANTITDLDDAVAGTFGGVPYDQTIWVIGRAATNTTTIGDSGNFVLKYPWTSPASGDHSVLELQTHYMTGSITAFADAGGGQVTVTSATHGLQNGQEITITGTTSYNGVFTVANVAANSYRITDTWVANDAAGTWVAYRFDETSRSGNVIDYFYLNVLVNAGSLTDFPYAQLVVGQADTAAADANNIGIAAEGLAANARNGHGVIGYGKSAVALPAVGVKGVGLVTATGDAATSYGVAGHSEATHASGSNVAGYFTASGGATNYALQIAAGNIDSTTPAVIWYLKDNNASALSWTATDAVDMLKIITTDGEETVAIAAKATILSSLNAATGNEYALDIAYTTNKGSSGDDYGLRIVQTDTASPGTSYLAHLSKTSGGSMTLDNAGNLALDSGAAATQTTTLKYNAAARGTIEASAANLEIEAQGVNPLLVRTENLSSASDTASVSLYSGAQSHAGDYDSGYVHVMSGDATTTLGDSGEVLLHSGAAADTSGLVSVYSGTSANTAEASGAVACYSGNQTHATGGSSGTASLYTGSAAGTSPSGNVDIYSGAATNSGDVRSGSVTISTGATTTDGVIGDITLKTGAAGAGATDAGSIYLQTHGASTRVSVAGSTGLLTAFVGADVQGGMITEGDGTYSWTHSPSGIATEGSMEVDGLLSGDLGATISGAALDVQGQMITEGDGTYSWTHAPTGIATEGSVEIDGMAYLDGGLTLDGPMICNPETIADGDATPDVSGGECFTTSANTGATAITDLDLPTAGQRVLIIGGSNTNSSTIADAANFNLDSKYGAMTLSVDAWILLYVQGDNDYIEIGRGDNTGLEAMTVASLDVSEGNITNVGDIGADSISADGDSTTKLALASGTLNYHISNNIRYTMDATALTCDAPETGVSANSPALALTGNYWDGANNRTGNAQLQGMFSAADPFLRISVDDSLAAGDGSLTGAVDIYDTGLVPVTAAGDLGATANPWHSIYGNYARIGPDSMAADANYALHVATATAGGGIRATSTAADATGAALTLQQDSVSPADGDVVGTVNFNGDDSAGNDTTYGQITTEIQDPANTPSEESIMRFKVLEGAGASTEYLRLDGTDAITGVVASRSVAVQNTKGQNTTVPIPTTAELTCDSAATLSTTAGFIPAGAWLVGVTTRITSAGLTGPTSMDIGDGTTANLWANDTGIADNDTTDNTDITAQWGNPIMAQSAVVLTWNGGNCTAGTVRVSAHYLAIQAPTAD